MAATLEALARRATVGEVVHVCSELPAIRAARLDQLAAGCDFTPQMLIREAVRRLLEREDEEAS